MENNKRKRFYKTGERVWVVSEKRTANVLRIDKEKLEVTLLLDNGETKILKLWEIDKLKFAMKEKLLQEESKSSLPTIYFAKVRKDAIIPSKREEDAGWDIYSSIEPTEVDGKQIKELYLPVLKTTLVPTGIAMALPNTHYFNTKHERGSTGKLGMSVLSGVIDSGYRGEIFIAVTPLHKDILITTEVSEVEVGENVILYPHSKAIAQGTIDLVPQVNIEEISFDELKNIESERGDTKLGQSGK